MRTSKKVDKRLLSEDQKVILLIHLCFLQNAPTTFTAKQMKPALTTFALTLAA